MKAMKKVLAMVMALGVVMGMSSAAFAANENAGGDIANKNIESAKTTVSIQKDLYFINAEATKVREPNIVYTYTLTAVTGLSGTTVRDDDGIRGTVKDGILGANTNSDHKATITFADTVTVNATSGTGTVQTKYADFTFNPSAFTAPGIYRYKITETVSPAKAAVGIAENATYNADRYLDVYVKKTSDTDPTLSIYGYTLFEDVDGTSFDDYSNPKVNIDKKSSGYVNTSSDGSTLADVDSYTTQNLYVEKATKGSMADLEQDFTLTFTVRTPGGVTATPKLDVTLESDATLTGTSSDTIGTYINLGSITTGTVDNESVITIKGIPVGTSAANVSITEKNDSPDSYKVKAGTVAGGDTLLAEAIVNAGGISGATTNQALSETVKIYFTNTLDAISPTGYVTRFAPYALLVAFALVLLVVVRRRRNEHADMI